MLPRSFAGGATAGKLRTAPRARDRHGLLPRWQDANASRRLRRRFLRVRVSDAEPIDLSVSPRRFPLARWLFTTREAAMAPAFGTQVSSTNARPPSFECGQQGSVGPTAYGMH